MKIRQPAFFIAGTEDAAINSFGSKALVLLPTTVPGLKGTRLISGAGHFVQEERAAEVNTVVIDFLRTL
jgi:pimeloyl-ACP methyl ester carboxylesterase